MNLTFKKKSSFLKHENRWLSIAFGYAIVISIIILFQKLDFYWTVLPLWPILIVIYNYYYNYNWIEIGDETLEFKGRKSIKKLNIQEFRFKLSDKHVTLRNFKTNETFVIRTIDWNDEETLREVLKSKFIIDVKKEEKIKDYSIFESLLSIFN